MKNSNLTYCLILLTMTYGILSIIWGSLFFTKGFKIHNSATCFASIDSCYPVNANDTSLYPDAVNMTNKFQSLNAIGFITCIS